MRELKASDLEGKTIKKVRTKAANVLDIKFDDGTKIEIFTDVVVDLGHGAGIYGFFVEEDDCEANS
jgi:hypothetical protein